MGFPSCAKVVAAPLVQLKLTFFAVGVAFNSRAAFCGAVTARQPVSGATAQPLGATQTSQKGHTVELPPTHPPPAHASPVVHALPSSQAVPSGWCPSAGQVALAPVHVSCASHWPVAARQTAP